MIRRSRILSICLAGLSMTGVAVAEAQDRTDPPQCKGKETATTTTTDTSGKSSSSSEKTQKSKASTTTTTTDQSTTDQSKDSGCSEKAQNPK